MGVFSFGIYKRYIFNIDINNKFVIILLRKEYTMYEIEFYEDKQGKSEVADYVREQAK